MKQTLEHFQTLVEIVARLRGPDGCPWDKEQTQESLTQYAIEEAFELVEAIESKVPTDIKEELGDFLFQVILQAQVAQDNKQFSIDDVLKSLNEKLIQRHPHVFGEAKAQNSEEVWKNWHKMKNEEGTVKRKPLFSFPKNLPALQAAYKIGVKTKGYQFDWHDIDSVVAKVKEELTETEDALKSKEKEKIRHEIGDLLFSAAQLARHADLEPEACLREANRRFERRFQKVVELSGVSIQEFTTIPDSDKEKLWTQAKKLMG